MIYMIEENNFKQFKSLELLVNHCQCSRSEESWNPRESKKFQLNSWNSFNPAIGLEFCTRFRFQGKWKLSFQILLVYCTDYISKCS